MSSSPIRPSGGKVSRKVKLLISSLYVLVPLGILSYRFYQGQTPDTMIIMIVLIFMIASGYVIFGERTIEKAQSTAQEIQSGNEEDEQ